MKLKWREETVYRAVHPRYVINVYQRTISRKWAFYVVNKHTGKRVSWDYPEFNNPEDATLAAEEAMDQILKKKL